MSQGVSAYPFRGGLDTTTAALMTSPSSVIAALNYEPLAEGYGRMQGYERFDGQPSPAAASFWSMLFIEGESEIAAYTEITGQTSAATAIICQAANITAGDWAGGDAAGELIVTAISGTFIDGEDIAAGAARICKLVGLPTLSGAPDIIEHQKRVTSAQSYYRSQIDKVPGSGPVRGVAVFNDEVYAWRDNIDATAGGMFKSTASGWQAVTLNRRIDFTAGLVEINEGDSIVGATSGATATAARVVRRFGDWGTTAAGYIILTGVTGSFASETIKVGGANVATATPDLAQTLPAGGQYETIAHNFYGGASSYGLYGVNGVGHAFEYRGGVFCFIETGTPTDTPNHIAQIAEHLLLGFPGGSVQHSAPGLPLIYEVIQGAGEFGFGTEITNMLQSNESAVAIFGQQKIGIFSGRDADTFQLAGLTEEAGAFAWTAQRIGRTVYMDMRGLRDLAATQAFGNFRTGSISESFDRYLTLRLAANEIPIGSIVSRTKSQYRVFWSDGTGLSIYMGGKRPEAMPISLGELHPYCMTYGDVSTEEYMLVGGEDGFVYRLDRGNTYDGVAFEYYIVTPFNHFGNAAQEDRFHKVVLEMIAPIYTEIGITAMFDYGDGEKPVSTGDLFILYGNGGIWNLSIWNSFVWSSAIEGRAEASIDGIGRNAAFVFAGSTTTEQEPHILQAYIVYRSPRKFKR